MQFIDVMCVTIVVTALPQMTADLDGTEADSSLIATAYATFFGGLLLFGARVGERFGHRRSILASVFVFAAAAAIAAMSHSALTLASSRGLQGAAAACAVPSALTLLTKLSSNERQRASFIAAWSASGAAAGITGYVVSGALTQLGDWRLIFWSLLAVSLPLAAAVLAFLPRDSTSRGSRPFNVMGALTATLTVMSAVVGATLMGAPARRLTGMILLAVAAGGVALFIVVDRRSKNPLVPAVLARSANTRWGSATAFVNTATTSGVATVLTVYVQKQLGHSPLGAAALLLPLSAMVIGGSIAAGKLDDRVGNAGTGAFGLALISLGIGVLVASSETSVIVMSATAVVGFGLGLSSVASTAIGLSVPEDRRTVASGLVNTAAQLGTALGTALLLLLAATPDHSPPPDAADPSAPRLAWTVAAVLAGGTSLLWFARRAR
ncbi:hypothetical protein CH293_03080 [Rhodococcus sp. 14-2470-1b]|uniref:MFS transporter n=1 Tax=Rhodococcus sp. 14-2470-1b TaxID=2023149 RepID=UPI000B9B5203|nr:MFS transporter [Rhodococcus sp. 14-2470-1b]OZF57705.1 hypothetical protein CH293_03080 [Rhodococcus sp. 14-2470-1b]